jgi:hypothetical protein
MSHGPRATGHGHGARLFDRAARLYRRANLYFVAVPHKQSAQHSIPHKQSAQHYIPHKQSAQHYIPHKQSAQHYTRVVAALGRGVYGLADHSITWA